MYAVIELKGAQVLIKKDDKFTVNRMEHAGEDTIKIDKVLFAQKGQKHYIGTPYVKDSYVECEIVGDKRAKKVIVFKYRERKSSQSKSGHRQDLTELKVKEIYLPEEKKAAPAKEKKEETKAKEKAAPKVKAEKKEEKKTKKTEEKK